MRYILSVFFMIGLPHFVLSQPIEPVPIPNAKFPVEIFVRFVNFEISDDSALRKDTSFNNPPRAFIIFKKNGKQVSECPELSGWLVNYPNNDNYEALINDNTTDDYAFEVWDKQILGSKLLFSVGPFKGSELHEKLKDNPIKNFEEGRVIILKSQDGLSNISLAYAGTRVWYRLVNVTIPAISPHLTSGLLNNPPYLYIGMHVEGEIYGSYSTVKRGWSVDFPNYAKNWKNCWTVREGTKRRYSIEVFDNCYFRDHLIFTVTDLSGISFRSKIIEKGTILIDPDRMSSILFERIPNPQ